MFYVMAELHPWDHMWLVGLSQGFLVQKEEHPCPLPGQWDCFLAPFLLGVGAVSSLYACLGPDSSPPADRPLSPNPGVGVSSPLDFPKGLLLAQASALTTCSQSFSEAITHLTYCWWAFGTGQST